MRKILKIITKRLPSFYIDVPALRPGTIGAYAFAFVCVAVATALRVALDPYLVGRRHPRPATQLMALQEPLRGIFVFGS
jgi:hypothetical protein